MRRQSTFQSDVISDARGSPHQHPDEFVNRDRRKSLLPPVANHRQSIKAGSMRLPGKKGKPGTKAPEERDKSAFPPPQNLVPTFRMEPERRFYAPQVHELLKQILENHLDGFTFNIKFTPTMTKVLSEEIKERCKGLNFERYKYMVSVVLGERKDQGIMISSRAAWDARLDNYATYTFQNKSLFCTASVYDVYAE